MARREARNERAPARGRRAESIEAAEAHAGDAQRVDVNAIRSRADAPPVLSAEALDERQAAIGERRRRGGPPLARGTRGRREAPQPPPAVPPTDCAAPPDGN